MKPGVVAFIAMLAGTSFALSADSITLASGTEKNQLIELYTSQGCSSCPAADDWLAGLEKNPDLWDDLVPIAFHVDYWDRLGWKDELASSEFSERQRDYRKQGGLSQVYTPGFVVNGEEWRGFFRQRKLPGLERQDVGEIIVTVDSSTVTAEFSPRVTSQEELVFHVAVLGFGMSTNVMAGENAGRTLHHDFAVIGYTHSRAIQEQDVYQSRFALPVLKMHTGRKAVVVWVSGAANQSPIQSAGNWL